MRKIKSVAQTTASIVGSDLNLYKHGREGAPTLVQQPTPQTTQPATSRHLQQHICKYTSHQHQTNSKIAYKMHQSSNTQDGIYNRKRPNQHSCKEKAPR